MNKRQSNRPDRRILADTQSTADDRKRIMSQVTYGGIAIHKLHPGDYGFHPVSNPRPSKSPCDAIRSILKKEAARLLRQGITKGMMSSFEQGGLPKYVWAVDEKGEVYEAKHKVGQETVYHGYRLGEDERDMRALVLKEWKQR